MGSIQELFSNIIRLITYIGGGLAVVYMMYGFVRYIMASGNPQAVDAAKSTIVQAAIGLVGIGGITLLLNLLVQVLPGGAGQNIAGILPDTSTGGNIPRVTSIGTVAALVGGTVVPAGGKSHSAHVRLSHQSRGQPGRTSDTNHKDQRSAVPTCTQRLWWQGPNDCRLRSYRRRDRVGVWGDIGDRD